MQIPVPILTHGSLFSGIGGFDLGFETAGIKTAWQVEIDPYCRRVLARHFPWAKQFSDIRECGSHNLPAIDILSGGFPCQDISNAGKRIGIEGERSGLWSEYARIICELRPSYVVVENVAALLGRGMERVLGDLAACGYDAEWQSIRASDVGAPHRRERIWIIACPNSAGCGKRRRAEPVSSSLDSAEFAGEIMADTKRAKWRENASDGHFVDGYYAGGKEAAGRFDGLGFAALSGEAMVNAKIFTEWTGLCEGKSDGKRRGRLSDASWWAVEPDVGRVAHGIPARVDRLRGLGNAIVPQIAEWIGLQIREAVEKSNYG